MQRTKIRRLALCAMFAAITAVLSQIVVPIGPVPINLATFAVLCSGALLGAKLGAMSMIVWAFMGLVGMPVFTMFRSGPGVLFGPTGGYIIGYIPAAFLVGLIVDKLGSGNKIYIYPLAMAAGAFTYFSLGTVWYMYLTNTGVIASLTACVIPFLPGDVLKIVAATAVCKALRPYLQRNTLTA